MEETKRQERNEQRLTELFPTFRSRVRRVLSALEAQGIRPRIQEAWRSPEDQLQAFLSGHSKLKFGFHNVTGASGEKEALAVDVLDDNSPLSPGKPYLLHLAVEAEKQGLMTGIRWGLPTKLAQAIDEAITHEDWQANVKVGWDPCHVQPTGITISEVKSGKRPT
jgi:hypothetical protein